MNNLSDRLSKIWSIDSSAVAVDFKGRQFTWGEVRQAASGIDRLLKDAGLDAGSAIGMLLRNRPSIVAAVLGMLVSERCIVCINPYHPPAALKSEIGHLKVAALIADEEDWASGSLAAAAQSTGSLGIQLSTPGGAPPTLVKGLEKVSPAAHRTVPAGIAIEMLTSGTTGKPKRLQSAYSALADAILSSVKDGPDGKITLKSAATIVSAPLVHVSGIFGMLYPICEGRPILLLEKFNVPEWVEAIGRLRIKFTSLPPAAIRMILDAGVPREALSSLIAVRSGTAPLTAEMQKRFEETYGIPVLIQYSATEWLGGIAGWTIEEHRQYMPAKRGSIGRAQPGVKLRVVDPESGNELPPGENGLLEVLPSKRFGPAADWNRTTDLASIDADGFVYIVGRSDDVIIRGGFKVNLPAVAEVMQGHPSVKDASVLGIDDPRLGQVPVCAVELHSDAAPVTEAELSAFARSHLLPYQVPAQFRIVPALPRTVSMKVDRPAVRALFGA